MTTRRSIFPKNNVNGMQDDDKVSISTARHSYAPSTTTTTTTMKRYRVRTYRSVIFRITTVILVISMISLFLQMESNLEISRIGLNVNSKNIDFNNPQGRTLSTKYRQQVEETNVDIAVKNDTTTILSDKNTLEIDRIFNDPPIFSAPIVNKTVQDFDTTISGVIVTKIQGPPHLRALRQMLCLLTQAYNKEVNYDIVVFTSEPIDMDDVEGLKDIVSPAKLTMIIDNPGLEQMVDALSLEQKNHLLDRCNVKSSSDLTWYTKCSEVRSYKTLKGERIAYNWQAEFRALHLWIHPVLQPYKYMMWMDSDAFCTRAWEQDPFAAMVRHDLVLLFDHFPQGAAHGSEFPAITREAFNRTVCDVSLVNGTLVASDGKCYGKRRASIKQVHGFFHVSNLDFYRSSPVMKWNRALIGDSKFSRLFDDQIGVTIPAAVLAGNRSRDMKSLGIYPRVFHNYVLDGIMGDWRGYFVSWWEKNANTTFPEASEKCYVDISA